MTKNKLKEYIDFYEERTDDYKLSNPIKRGHFLYFPVTTNLHGFTFYYKVDTVNKTVRHGVYNELADSFGYFDPKNCEGHTNFNYK